jgi:hypothetical protein
MISTSRETKIWIFISLFSLLLWTIYWTYPSSLERIYDILISGQVFAGGSFGGLMYAWMEVSGAIGTLIRSIGVVFGIIILYLMSVKNKSLIDVKKLLATALFIEAFYYFMVSFPSGTFMTTVGYGGQYVTLGVAYFIQFLVTTPFLVILGFKVYRHKQNEGDIIKWVGFAFVGYITALWSNSVFRWFDMIANEGFSVFFTGIRAVGSLNAFIVMSLAVGFGALGVYYLLKGRKVAIKWAGLALGMVGLHYLIYLVYSYFGGMINFVLIIEVWAITLLGLGVSIVRKK